MLLKAYVKVTSALAALRDDESGAGLVEYSLLIGLITVGTVATIAIIGPWVTDQW